MQLIAFFVKKDNTLLVICARTNLTENHKALISFLSKDNHGFKVVILSRIKTFKSFDQLKAYPTISWPGFWSYLKAKKIVITHGEFDYKPYTKMRHQTVINMWHGIPLKKIGLQVNKCKTSWDFHIVNSVFEKEIIRTSFALKDHQVVVLGTPKNDLLFSQKDRIVKKQVLYLNTFRSDDFSKFFELENRCLDEINSLLLKYQTTIIFKLHPSDVNNPNIEELKAFSQFKIASNLFDIQTELTQSLALITDYSGVVFDALAIDKPVILLPYDFDEYDRKVGFNRDYKHFLPSSQVLNQANFLKLLEQALKHEKIEEQQKEKSAYFEHIDQKSSLRLVRFLKSL